MKLKRLREKNRIIRSYVHIFLDAGANPGWRSTRRQGTRRTQNQQGGLRQPPTCARVGGTIQHELGHLEVERGAIAKGSRAEPRKEGYWDWT